MRSDWGDGDHDAAGVSPRISFSNDFAISDELTSAGGDHDATVDFDFDFDFTLCPDVPTLADDLFSEGKLLPLPIKRPPTTTLSSSPPPAPSPANPPPKQLPATTSSDRNGDSPQDVTANSHENLAGGRSFSLRKALVWSSGSLLLRSKSSGASPELQNIKQWSSQRSSSLNFSSVGNQRRFSRNCPIPLLCRSKSDSPRAMRSFKPCNSPSGDNTKSRVYYYSGNPSSRRSSHANNKAVRISPILNVPMPRIMGIFNFCFPYKRGV
ncbi:uncharacterized protein LOC121994803 [Zingiber officinale]|uniref:uncharacterized protein LOC121994803 n=1 Tax=Zingiber officinale TaxID=94328 RepID=UPI001C4BE95A|nr:uncharacterized protein LOC121994803 [Zingiber officinale]